MKPVERSRTRVITVRPTQGAQTPGRGRVATWEALCGDCGACGPKPFPTKGAATKAAQKHDKEAHGGDAVIRIRQA